MLHQRYTKEEKYFKNAADASSSAPLRPPCTPQASRSLNLRSRGKTACFSVKCQQTHAPACPRNDLREAVDTPASPFSPWNEALTA